jgi:hypothetical protein
MQMDARESFIKMTLDEDKRLRRLNGSLAPSAKRLERAANTSPYDTC